jgi:putative acetyltransferase
MYVRDLRPGEERVLWKLFYDTIHSVNIRHYSQSQVDAWAPEDLDPSVWEQKMQSICPFVAEIDDQIIGYSDLQTSGLIDHFFVHHLWQRRGVGRLLMTEIDRRASRSQLHQLETHASITARPFFEAFAFVVVREQELEMRGVKLRNYFMQRTH